MHIREIREGDIEAVIQLFRKNYGDYYAIPNFGDYNDQIGEIGRLVVDPELGGHGLGRSMLTALVEASDEQVEFAFAEARTVHPKTQKIDDRIGLVALGFLPMYYLMAWRESLVLSGQLFGNGRGLRRPGTAEVIPSVAPLARLSLRNLELDENVTIQDAVRPYPLDQSVPAEPLTGASLVRLLRIEQGRVVEPEMFGGMHIDQGLSPLRARKAEYLVAADGDRTLGAVGYVFDEHNRSVRLTELATDEAVKGSLVRLAVDEAERRYEADIVKCDVSATSPRLQQTLADMGFLPAAYVPGMVFHQTARWDVVRTIKLNVPWDLGPLELTEASQGYFDLVAPAFQQASAVREGKQLALNVPLLTGLTPLEIEFLQHVCGESTPAAGQALPADALHIVLSGSLVADGRSLAAGEFLGTGALLGRARAAQAVAGKGRAFCR